MKKYISIAMLLFPFNAIGETYICVPEAGAGVAHGGKQGIHSFIVNTDNKIYIQTHDGRSWKVMIPGADSPLILMDECESEHFCDGFSGLYTGTFMRDKDGYFSITRIIFDEDNQEVLIVMKGRCTKI